MNTSHILYFNLQPSNACAVSFANPGLYGIMLGYVVFTLSQHISPVYVGMSILTVLSP